MNEQIKTANGFKTVKVPEIKLWDRFLFWDETPELNQFHVCEDIVDNNNGSIIIVYAPETTPVANPSMFVLGKKPFKVYK